MGCWRHQWRAKWCMRRFLGKCTTDSCNSNFIFSWPLVAQRHGHFVYLALIWSKMGQNTLKLLSCGSHISAAVRPILVVQSSCESSWLLVVQRHGHFVHLTQIWPTMDQNTCGSHISATGLPNLVLHMKALDLLILLHVCANKIW